MIATPTNPTPTAESACQERRSPFRSRSTTIHSGTDAMISDASPVGTSRSAKNSTAFAPGSKMPITTHETSARRGMRRDVPRSATIPAISRPAVMKRVDTANSGGIVSPAIAIPR